MQTYLASRFCAGTALTLMRATVLWHVYDLTESPLWLGLVGLVQFVPSVVMALAGGVMADRFNRTRIVRIAQTAAFLVSPPLLLATWADLIQVPWLLLAVGMVAATGSLEQPARASLLVGLVPREEFPRVVTRAATVQALAFATGPAVGGVLIGLGGPALAYGLHTLLMAASIFFLRRLPAMLPTGTPLPLVQSLAEGFGVVLRNRVVLACMVLDMCAVILGGANALLPIFAEDVLRVGPTWYGALPASMELGALGMSLYLAMRAPIQSTGRTLLWAVVAYGVATIGFGLSRSFPLSLLMYCIVGAADQISVVLRHTAVQMSTPDHVRGRVSAINMLFIHASNQLGALESGLLAAAIGAPMAVTLGGVGAILVTGLVALLVPALRNYRVNTPAVA